MMAVVMPASIVIVIAGTHVRLPEIRFNRSVHKLSLASQTPELLPGRSGLHNRRAGFGGRRADNTDFKATRPLNMKIINAAMISM